MPRPLSDLLDAALASSQSAEGRERTRRAIDATGGPWYSTGPANPDLILERTQEGTTRLGRFENGVFQPLPKQ